MDDPIFPTDTQTQTEAPETTVADAPGAGQQPASPPQVQATMPPEVDGRLSAIEKGLGDINSFFQRLNEQQDQPAPQENPDMSDFSDRFYADPQSTIQKEIQTQAAPLIGQQATSMADLVIEKQQQSLDDRFGEGAWKEYVEPKLGPVIDKIKRTDPGQLLNRSAIENAVKTLIGENFDGLMERRQGRLSQNPENDLVEKVTERVMSSPGLIGGIRRVSPTQKQDLEKSEVAQDYLEGILRNTGESRDIDRLASMVNTGNTLEEWQKANESLNGSGKAKQ